MKKTVLIFGIITFAVTACDFLEIKEKKAIEICKTTRIQFSSEDGDVLANVIANSIGGFALGLNRNATWQDFANMLSGNEPNKKQEWKAYKTGEEGVYMVSFRDENGWGYSWEVVLATQTVKYINKNEYLSRKYGFGRLDNEGNFEITKITTNTIKVERVRDYYGKYTQSIVCVLNASVINRSGKSLTEAEISGHLKAVFKDKTITGNSGWESGFKSKVTRSKPWLPNTEKVFQIKTQGIEELYLDYTPEYVFFEISLQAEDPIGFSYNRNIAEFDLKEKWGTLKR